MLHRALKQQLQKLGLDAGKPPDAATWQAFLDRISRDYAAAQDELFEPGRAIAPFGSGRRIATGPLQLDNGWLPVMDRAMDEQEPAVHTNGKGASLAVPINYADELIGVLGFDSEDRAEWGEEDLAAVVTIAEQLGLALENQRLFDQTQRALAETESLYQLGARLNAANSFDEILAVVAEAEIAGRPDRVSLATLELDANGRPEWSTLVAIWVPEDAHDLAERIPVGTRFYLPEISAAQEWLNRPNKAVLIDNVIGDKRIDASLEESYEKIDAAATATIPLTIGEKWVGLFNIVWTEPQKFTQRDQRYFDALAAQTSIAVNNQLLLQETEARADQLQRLAVIESSLSQATSEDDIVAALAMSLDDDPSLHNVTLNYLELDEAGRPEALRPISAWGDGGIVGESPLYNRPIDLGQFAVSELWISRPNELLLISDIFQDPRCDEAVIEQGRLHGFVGLAILPLHSAGTWQGVVMILWSEAHTFVAGEQFVLRQLVEPLAAVVASRRAQLAQQAALSETAALYQASAELNVVQSYDDIIDILRRHTIIGQASSNVSLNYFDVPWNEEQPPQWIEVLARWSQLPPESHLPRYPLAAYPSAETLLSPSNPTVVEDFTTDPRLDETARSLFLERFGARGAIFAPLMAGNQWVGFVLGMFPEPRQFTQAEIRRLVALSGQAAVVSQSIRLLEATRAQARREQMLREITEKVRRLTGVEAIMKTAVEEVGRALGRQTTIYLQDGHGIPGAGHGE